MAKWNQSLKMLWNLISHVSVDIGFSLIRLFSAIDMNRVKLTIDL